MTEYNRLKIKIILGAFFLIAGLLTQALAQTLLNSFLGLIPIIIGATLTIPSGKKIKALEKPPLREVRVKRFWICTIAVLIGSVIQLAFFSVEGLGLFLRILISTAWASLVIGFIYWRIVAKDGTEQNAAEQPATRPQLKPK